MAHVPDNCHYTQARSMWKRSGRSFLASSGKAYLTRKRAIRRSQSVPKIDPKFVQSALSQITVLEDFRADIVGSCGVGPMLFCPGLLSFAHPFMPHSNSAALAKTMGQARTSKRRRGALWGRRHDGDENAEQKVKGGDREGGRSTVLIYQNMSNSALKHSLLCSSCNRTSNALWLS